MTTVNKQESEAKLLRTEDGDIEVFAPKKETFINELEGFIDEYKKMSPLNPQRLAKLQKMESRVEELNGLYIVS